MNLLIFCKNNTKSFDFPTVICKIFYGVTKEVLMKAKDNGVNYEILVQYDGLESDLSAIYERVKKTYVESGNDIDSIKDIKLYLKRYVIVHQN